MIRKIKIITNGISEKERNTLFFAAEELQKYLSQCVSEAFLICEAEHAADDAVLLGIGLREDLPAVEDPYYDDAILIDVKASHGIITGTNARSVLIGVYRYLRELGYTFVRPGKEGEKYPEQFLTDTVFVAEAPSNRYRTVCIEGSVFYESVADMIDWLPKVGMNGYYTQFFTPWIFFKRWYLHQCYEFTNPYLSPEKLTPEEVEGFTKTYERELSKRSLLYIKVGHGWTCDPFGMTSLGWEGVPADSLPEGIEAYAALVNGERRIHQKNETEIVPLMNQLCYGNPQVREKIVDYFVTYCKQNPQVDIVGFSLGDGDNNYCECELCRHLRPSDHKVRMVREINQRMKEEGLHTKVIFDLYIDHLWTPLQERFPEDQSKLLVSFCPASRTYTRPFPTNTDSKVGPFTYNQLSFPESVEDLLAYVEEWKKLYHGEMICFDYYYMWDCYKDLGMTETARVIHQDICNYKELNITGLISCQGQRVFCPTSLGMNVMAHTLWNNQCDFDQVRNEVLRAEFGPDYACVKEYLQDLSVYSLPEVTRMEKPLVNRANTEMYKKCLKRLRDFTVTINSHITAAANDCERISWQNLRFHSELSIMLMTAFKAMSEGADPVPFWAPIEDYVNRHEWEMKQYFDVFEFKYTYGRLFPVIAREQKEIILGM